MSLEEKNRRRESPSPIFFELGIGRAPQASSDVQQSPPPSSLPNGGSLDRINKNDDFLPYWPLPVAQTITEIEPTSAASLTQGSDSIPNQSSERFLTFTISWGTLTENELTQIPNPPHYILTCPVTNYYGNAISFLTCLIIFRSECNGRQGIRTEPTIMYSVDSTIDLLTMNEWALLSKNLNKFEIGEEKGTQYCYNYRETFLLSLKSMNILNSTDYSRFLLFFFRRGEKVRVWFFW